MSEVAAEERWRDLRRMRLLDAAGRVFSRDGYEAASVDEIAFEAGIGKPTLYRYFAGKEAIFQAVFAQALDDLEARLDAAMDMPGPFETRLARMIFEIVPTFRTHLGSMSTLEGQGGDSKRRILRQRRAHIEERLASVIEAAQAQGLVRTFDARVCARFITGMVRGCISAGFLEDGPLAETVLDFALHGLAANGKS